jgi:hypothetical protein
MTRSPVLLGYCRSETIAAGGLLSANRSSAKKSKEDPRISGTGTSCLWERHHSQFTAR